MNYRRLGKTGLRLSELSFGAWVTFGNQLDDRAAQDCMAAAYDAGVNFFDNAEAYADGRAEEQMGRVLKNAGWRRESLVVSTKLYWGGAGPNDKGLSHKHLLEGANASLKRLGLEYVDLLFCHRPDRQTPIEETVRAMDLIVRQGKAFYWGTSEWSAAEVMRADGLARQYGLTPPAMEQPHYNMLVRERFESEYDPLYRELGYGTTTWSPLASGLLSGKYNDGIPPGSRLSLPEYAWLRKSVATPERLQKVRQLGPIAQKLGCTQSQLAIAWCLKNPNVSTVITGASRVEQVRENLGAVEVAARLGPDVLAEIEQLLDNKPRIHEF